MRTFLVISAFNTKRSYHLLDTGEGCAAQTSIPKCLTSGANPAAKAERNALVALYVAPNGDGMQAAADEVNTMQPLSCLSICQQQTNAPDCMSTVCMSTVCAAHV